LSLEYKLPYVPRSLGYNISSSLIEDKGFSSSFFNCVLKDGAYFCSSKESFISFGLLGRGNDKS
jgi:hypothetical protein